jgi:hypothetical protein
MGTRVFRPGGFKGPARLILAPVAWHDVINRQVRSYSIQISVAYRFGGLQQRELCAFLDEDGLGLEMLLRIPRFLGGLGGQMSLRFTGHGYWLPGLRERGFEIRKGIVVPGFCFLRGRTSRGHSETHSEFEGANPLGRIPTPTPSFLLCVPP